MKKKKKIRTSNFSLKNKNMPNLPIHALIFQLTITQGGNMQFNVVC